MPIGCLEIWSLLTDKLCALENKLDLKFDETHQILKFDLHSKEKQIKQTLSHQEIEESDKIQALVKSLKFHETTDVSTPQFYPSVQHVLCHPISEGLLIFSSASSYYH